MKKINNQPNAPAESKVVRVAVVESAKRATIADKIQKISFKLATYFTSAEVVKALRSAHKTMVIHRGAINAAIASLVKRGKVAMVRHGAGRRDTIWTLAHA